MWLFGRTLEEKLLPLEALFEPSARPPGGLFPNRPPGLEMARRGASLPGDIKTEADRCRVLHVFANHELLAIELFAWALLRWPDAPLSFRRGLAAIIGEEQAHLALYLARMRSLGAEFGEHPLSGFLWTALSRCETPLQFSVGMGMGFEQANLDHARGWATRFAAAGDAETSALLTRISEDEIGHVRHGVRWFERWRDPSVDRKTAWEQAFVPPMTPARSRGTPFWTEGRERAGIPPEIIELVRGYAASKGRPGDVYWFNPAAEAHAGAARDLGTEPRPVREVAADLGPLLGFLAGEDDVVLVTQEPRPAWLAELASNVPIPAFRTSLPPGPVRRLRPWAATPDTARIGVVPLTDRRLFMRTALTGFLRERWPVVDGWISADDLPMPTAATATPLAMAGWLARGRVVVKQDFSASGRNRRWLDAMPVALPSEAVAEPWLDRVADFSAQLTLVDGRASVDGVGRFLTDSRGQYRGAILGDPAAGLEPDVARFLHGRLGPWMKQAVMLVTPWLVELGFSGAAGIDAMVVRTPSGLRFHPIVELNPRMTMGRVSLALSRRVARAATWWHLPIAARGWLDSLPEPRWERGILHEGRWWTTDPDRAVRILTAVIAARHVADLPVWAEDPASR